MNDKTMIEMSTKIHMQSHQIKTAKLKDHIKIKVNTQSGSPIGEDPEAVVEAIEEVTEMTFNVIRLIEIVSTQLRIRLSSKKMNMNNKRINLKNRKVVISLTISSKEVVVVDSEEEIEAGALTINVEELITRRT